MSSYNIWKYFDLLLKAVVVLVFIYILTAYFKTNNWDKISSSVSIDDFKSRWYYLVFVLLLMPLNWLIESIKWRAMMNNYREISLATAYKSILCGVTCGLITPARVGDFLGRLLVIDAGLKKQSVYASFICSLSQNIATLIIGLIACVYFISNIHNFTLASKYIIITNVLIISVGLILYYFHRAILSYFSSTNLYRKHLGFLDSYVVNINVYHKVLLLAIFRLVVYASQYLLVLLFIGISSSMWYNIVAVCTIFLIQSTIPLPPLMGLLARGEIAVIILGLLGYSTITALLAAGLLWVINLICPALLGLIHILKLNLWRSIRS